MSSDKSWQAFRLTSVVIAMVAATSGCGLFGKKHEASRTVSPQTDGCYNDLSSKVERYFSGTISEVEWVSTFECVDSQIDFFARFVRPSSDQGYTLSDIGSLTRRFLITNHSISDAFVRGIFALKASTVGGPTEFITPSELDEFLKISRLLRRETIALLPLIRTRVQTPSVESDLALADGLDHFGKNLGEHFSTINGTQTLHKDVFIPFMEELLRLTGGDESRVERYGNFVRQMKVASSGGSSDVIEPKAWTTLIQDCAAFGGLYLAWSDLEKIVFAKDAEKSRYYLDLMARAEKYTQRIIVRRGGSITLGELEQLIDTVPAPELSATMRTAIKADLPNLVNFFLQGKVEGSLDVAALENLVNLFEAGMQGQMHIQNIYDRLPASVSAADFESAAVRYRSLMTSEEARLQIDSIISTAKTFRGLFPNEGSVLRIDREGRAQRSKNHLQKMHWFRTAIRYVLKVYGTGENGSGKKKDLLKLIGHFDHIVRALKKVHPTMSAEEMTDRRFREANLFMPNSNGDSLMTDEEGTYYVAFLFSAGTLSSRIFADIVEDRRLCPVIGVDDLGEPAVGAQCFREMYFANVDTYWQSFPGLLTAYGRLSVAKREALQRSMEVAARTGGYSDKPIGHYDMDSFAALPHYVEDIMERFDLNQDNVLVKDEVFRTKKPRGAYYVFRNELSKFAGVKQEWLLKCAFSYLIKYGREPDGAWRKAHLLTWCAWRPFWSLDANRSDLYNIVGLISSAAPKTPWDGSDEEDLPEPEFPENENGMDELPY